MKFLSFFLFACMSVCSYAQDTPNPRPITMEEYEKAKGFIVGDLDKDTYVKFENKYLLDRYELRKPYFITGDDKLKKRVDLYRLLAKEGMQELGLMIFYTTETGKVYKALLPNFSADGAVWNKYFEDIHAIDKIEKNFVLKLSYVISRELSYQQYKGINQGKDLSKESATYGNDICFPGDQLVAMEDGSSKLLSEIRPGDRVTTVDALTGTTKSVKVEKLLVHEPKNYALISLLLVRSEEKSLSNGTEITLRSKVIEATPNHPMSTDAGEKNIGSVAVGEKILCGDNDRFELYTVLDKKEFTKGSMPVYNIEASEGTTFVMNSVMVKQK